MIRMWLWTFHQWKKAACAEVLPPNPQPDTVAIVLCDQCPQNIDVIVQCLLRTPSIAKITVMNNNPEVRMSDWLRVQDPRVTVIDQPVRRPSHIRYAIAARENDYQRFLSMDDDLFLKPSQLEALCTALRTDPLRPHGVVGLQYDSWRGMMYHNVRHHTQTVDVISRVLAFTSAHVEGLYSVARDMGFGPQHAAWEYSYWDDLFLSFAAGKPMVHSIGAYLEYPTHGQAAMQQDVCRLRLPLLLRLRDIRPQA